MAKAKKKKTPGKPRNRQRAMPAANAFTYSVRDVQAMVGIGKSTVFKMLKDGRLERVNAEGCPTLVKGDSLRRMLGI